jgi:hypothetical protein
MRIEMKYKIQVRFGVVFESVSFVVVVVVVVVDFAVVALVVVVVVGVEGEAFRKIKTPAYIYNNEMVYCVCVFFSKR